MDLVKLEKKAFFIPTPGQFEQEYLAKRLKKKGIIPYANQDDFRMKMLGEIQLYSGFPMISEEAHWKHLFTLFQP
jgi:hypothetical protein